MPLKPDNRDALLGLGDAQRGLTRYAEALTAYHSASPIKDTSDTSAQAYENSVIALSEALRLRLDYSAASFELGFAYYKLEQYPKALAAFQKALVGNRTVTRPWQVLSAHQACSHRRAVVESKGRTQARSKRAEAFGE